MAGEGESVEFAQIVDLRPDASGYNLNVKVLHPDYVVCHHQAVALGALFVSGVLLLRMTICHKAQRMHFSEQPWLPYLPIRIASRRICFERR